MNHLQIAPKKVKQILDSHNFYIGQVHFKSPPPNTLYTIVTISPCRLPKTCLHAITLTLSKIKANSKNSSVFPSSQSSTSSSFSLGHASCPTSFCKSFIYILLQCAICKEISGLKQQQYIHLP